MRQMHITLWVTLCVGLKSSDYSLTMPMVLCFSYHTSHFRLIHHSKVPLGELSRFEKLTSKSGPGGLGFLQIEYVNSELRSKRCSAIRCP